MLGVGRLEEQQLGQLVLVVEVLADALLDGAAELVPEGAVALRLAVLELRQPVEHLLDQALAYGADQPVALEHLARDVERQVGGLDHALDEAQIARQERLAALHDHHPLDVELEAGLEADVEEVVGRLGRDEQQRLVLEPPLGPERDVLHRVVPVVGDVLVELGVLLVADLGLWLGPDGRAGVDRGLLDHPLLDLRVLGHAVLVPLDLLVLGLQDDRVGDEVGVALDHPLQDELVGEVVDPGLFVDRLEMEGDGGAAVLRLGVRDRVLAGAFGLPAGAGLLAGPAGHQLDPVGGHERRVEADAELADELQQGLLGLGLLEALDQLLAAGAGDRADVVDHLLAAHADAVVGDRQGAGPGVGLDADLERVLPHLGTVLAQGLEAQAVEGVGGVRDQLPKEDLLVGVKGMDHQVEQLARLGLELAGLASVGFWARRRRFAHDRDLTPFNCSDHGANDKFGQGIYSVDPEDRGGGPDRSRTVRGPIKGSRRAPGTAGRRDRTG